MYNEHCAVHSKYCQPQHNTRHCSLYYKVETKQLIYSGGHLGSHYFIK